MTHDPLKVSRAIILLQHLIRFSLNVLLMFTVLYLHFLRVGTNYYYNTRLKSSGSLDFFTSTKPLLDCLSSSGAGDYITTLLHTSLVWEKVGIQSEESFWLRKDQP